MATGPSGAIEQVDSIADVIAQMAAIDAALPAGDGIAEFNRMYLAVTRAVGAAVDSGVFANSSFLERLDVVFANLYFAALANAEAGEPASRCWQVLVDHRGAADRLPIQFALAGMNAHINHDLVVALITTFTDLESSPASVALEADFDRVNALLASLEAGIRTSFESGAALRLEEHLGGLENCLGSWSISGARTVAWHDSVALWKVRHHEALLARLERHLDEAVAIAGKCLLLPIDHHSRHDDDAVCGIRSSVLANA